MQIYQHLVKQLSKKGFSFSAGLCSPNLATLPKKGSAIPKPCFLNLRIGRDSKPFAGEPANDSRLSPRDLTLH
jgi:hypothetical protein